MKGELGQRRQTIQHFYGTPFKRAHPETGVLINYMLPYFRIYLPGYRMLGAQVQEFILGCCLLCANGFGYVANGCENIDPMAE